MIFKDMGDIQLPHFLRTKDFFMEIHVLGGGGDHNIFIRVYTFSLLVVFQ